MNNRWPAFLNSLWLSAVIVIVTCVGCGESIPPRVQGTVSLNGVPVKQGEIRLLPIDGTEPEAAGIIADGNFSLEATTGKKRVEIQAYENEGMKPMDPAMPGSAMVPVLKPQLPEKYNTASELTLEVSGDTEHDFNLSLP